MQTEIIFAGFGGQGVLFGGQLLAYAGMDEGKEVTWIPSYGPEMRGGTANCTVVISDEEIGSPMVRNPQAVIAMNRPSLDKYEPLVKPGGVLIINTSMVDRKATRKDIKVIEVNANEEAEKLGDQKMANMVLLGALLANLPFLPPQSIEKALKAHLPERHQKLLPKNYEALHLGANFIP
jgi:2-oxoglutarate ferredoxin oxidoreductase subunit gamma